jgi:hypothetical protein
LRFRTLLLSLLPGLSHIHLGRPGRGILYFLLFSVSLNATLLAPLLVPGLEFRLGCGLATGGFWVLALTDAWRIVSRRAVSHRAAALAAALAGDDESQRVTRRAEVPRG